MKDTLVLGHSDYHFRHEPILYDEVVLVTANIKDFGDGQEPAALSTVLLDDLARMGLPSGRVRLATSLKTLVDEIVQPLSAPDARATRLLTDMEPRAKIVDAIIDTLVAAEIPQEYLELGVNLDGDPNALGADVHSVDLISTRELSDGRLLLELNATGDLLLSMLVFKGDLHQVDDNPRMHITQFDWNRHYAEVETEITVEMVLQVTSDLSANDLEVELLEVVRAGVGPV